MGNIFIQINQKKIEKVIIGDFGLLKMFCLN